MGGGKNDGAYTHDGSSTFYPHSHVYSSIQKIDEAYTLVELWLKLVVHIDTKQKNRFLLDSEGFRPLICTVSTFF